MMIMLIKVDFEFRISERYEYYVSHEGKVFRVDTRNGKFEECYYHVAHGYKRIRVTDIDTNKRRYIRVHRLVAKYFIYNKNKDFNIVNHIDCDKFNNHFTNLEWCNISINTQHAYDNDLVKDRGGWKSTPYLSRINK